MKKLTLLLLLGLPLLVACTSSVNPYPENWKPLPKEPPEDCLIKNGFYRSEGMEGSDAGTLSAKLGMDNRAELVRFHTDDGGGLTVSAVRYGEVIGQRQFDDSAAVKPRCSNGWLLFDTSGWESGRQGAGYQSGVLGLLAVNDHLIVKHRGSFVGWVYIMPMAARGQRWGLYPWLGELDLELLKEQALERQKRATPYNRHSR